MSDLDEYLLNLNAIQRRWVYLEPIFGRGALPREEARFKRVDEDFRFSKLPEDLSQMLQSKLFLSRLIVESVFESSAFSAVKTSWRLAGL